jgi:alpha-L-fucosidase
VIFTLGDVVSNGGNYLLNVGPMANGEIPCASHEILRTVGRWLRVNGDAVYGANPTPFGAELGEPSARGARNLRGEPLVCAHTEWRVTSRPGKLYFTFFEAPRALFPSPAMRNAVHCAYRLADRSYVGVATEHGRRVLNAGGLMIDTLATVVVVEVAGDTIDAIPETTMI